MGGEEPGRNIREKLPSGDKSHPPEEIRNKYPLILHTTSIKYLGINVPKDLSKVFECNFLPVENIMKEDIARWNLIPFFNIFSRIESIKNIYYLDYYIYSKPYRDQPKSI